MKSLHFLLGITCIASLTGCVSSAQVEPNSNLDRARQTLDSLYLNYSVDNSSLLRENYPFDEQHTVTYLASEEQANIPNQFSYLWPYSGTFSAVNALFEATHDKKYKKLLDSRVLPGLEEYFDTQRVPNAYSSYIRTAPASDRFYDDNVWLGIDFTDTYQMTQEQKYLDKAQLIWKFIESGTDSILGGGIYWCEQKKESKNTCSNAPGSVLALKLFKATNDSSYFEKGKKLYEWTQRNLQDSADYLYFDNIRLDGKIGKAKFAYNSGQMMQSAALLYQLTKNPIYLKDAQNIAKECFNYFFTDFTPATNEEAFRMLKKGDIWFTAVMLRGFIELYRIDKDKTYINAFNKSLSYAWDNARDENGLFNTDLSGKSKDQKKWLLTQAAMVEMYSRLAMIQ
ncbi:glycoside hydrolase family 76 protein [Bacteroides faecis]|jgi:alpha-1,6-mannanase|uniref:glycoside hydrolase family 76 protein n=1 Tax=Bacteroides faecis TaxID=674529 RepID=UPI000D65A091|nr:glycoside hydrolase family 76 protein [Bacteroides faecis]KAA5268175.1 alpha-1,6-mannanase [Bacteroides faecis]MCE9011024.1 glycoside hydrolase family 76 protein [Bacteroides faecis]MCS2650860.1 glycoside hydrolase family 76 protein [Bacteroides faecis]RYT86730.1 alpha-1,6-mannanase [Bacteroides faecis]UYU55150.1 glycoside hydrolase family 76 protein [Bacteroides faecis]